MCEHCGAELVLRTARKGRNAGGQFWGCSAWRPGEQHTTLPFDAATATEFEPSTAKPGAHRASPGGASDGRGRETPTRPRGDASPGRAGGSAPKKVAWR